MSRIYISGPITGKKNYMTVFADAAENLKNSGHEVINPAAFNAVLPKLSYEEYMMVDLQLLDMCDAIYMLQGWQESRGAKQGIWICAGKGLHHFGGVSR